MRLTLPTTMREANSADSSNPLEPNLINPNVRMRDLPPPLAPQGVKDVLIGHQDSAGVPGVHCRHLGAGCVLVVYTLCM